MAKNNYTVIILVVIIAAALLLAPTAISSLGNLWNKGWNDLWSSLKTNSTATVGTGLTIIIQYTDGTNDTVKQPAFALLPISITVPSSGREIWACTCEVRAQLTTNEAVAAWKFSGTIKTSVDNIGDLATKDISDEGTTWDPTWNKLIGSGSTSATDLKNAVSSHGDGTYIWRAKADITVTTTFGDGTTDEEPGGAEGTLEFKYTAPSIASLVITIQPFYYGPH
jgi:hypothetical protein